MPQSGLTLQFTDLQKHAAYFVYGIDGVDSPLATALAASELRNLNRLIFRGLRAFYYPQQISGTIYDWPFLRSKLTLLVQANQGDYEMPYAFGGALGTLRFGEVDSVFFPVRKVSQEIIDANRATNVSTTGFPQMYTERPVMHAGREGTRWEILVWPTPDATYTLTGTMRIHPLAPDTTATTPQLYLYGGPEHEETILASVLASCELFLEGQPGPMAQDYERKLRTSIAMCALMHPSEKLGYNGNSRNAGRFSRGGRAFDNYSNVTFNGTDYGS
jgi:hypothetical protein